uniref:Uncharacterized protein n=1 Tax=Anguilla anguilla TaxID=7936 RepID=A0A0E9TRD9_ANGAN
MRQNHTEHPAMSFFPPREFGQLISLITPTSWLRNSAN